MHTLTTIPAWVRFYGIAMLLLYGVSLQAVPIMKTSSQVLVDSVTVSRIGFQQDYGRLLLLFKKAGIYVINNSKVKRQRSQLKEIKFQLIHPQGMNFKLRITDFTKLTFCFVFDEWGQCLYFTFRINEEEVYQHIPLDTEGFKSYDCFQRPYQIVQRGETNNSIERYDN